MRLSWKKRGESTYDLNHIGGYKGKRVTFLACAVNQGDGWWFWTPINESWGIPKYQSDRKLPTLAMVKIECREYVEKCMALQEAGLSD